MVDVTWKKRLDDLRLESLSDLFGVDKPVIGMVHLWPLPGAPGHDGYGMDTIREHALGDAGALLAGGVDGLIVENMWDLPYYVGADPQIEAVAAQAIVAREVAQMAEVPVGVNVIHNGWQAELAIAVAAELDFMRVCILTGARLWDTGDLDQGCAADLLRRRKELSAEHIKLFADVDKKHSVPFPGLDLETHIEWTEFYRADALIVSGRMTGAAPPLAKVRRAKEAATRPILMGSGTTEHNIADFLRCADGAIVGSSLKVDGLAENRVDIDRVRRYMAAVRSVRES
ncbi:MAG: BtpA/SgcQ family protein [Anaerolineae bacterium]